MTTIMRSARLTIWMAALLVLMATAHADEGETECLDYQGNPYYSDVDNRAMCWIREKTRAYEERVNRIFADMSGLDPFELEGSGPFDITRAEFAEVAGNVLESFRLRRFEFAGPDTRQTRKVVYDRKEAALRLVLRTYDDFVETAGMVEGSIARARAGR